MEAVDARIVSPGGDPLENAVAMMLEHRADFAEDPRVRSMVAAARQRFGDSVRAVVLYGSYTRGSTDTLLDFYVLLDELGGLPFWQRFGARLLPPNVYQLVTEEARAKVAVMRFADLERAVVSDCTPYFWARFAQPVALVYQADGTVRRRFVQLVAMAAERLVAASAAVNSMRDPRTFWVRTFALTYASELRSERADRYLSLYEAAPAYFDRVYDACVTRSYPPQAPWWMRRLGGRVLSVLRLMKSALTFDDPVDYALWKVARHSGVTVTATERQRKYPLLFAWPLVWRLYRLGALK